MHKFMDRKKMIAILKSVLEFFVKIFLVLAIYGIWCLVFRKSDSFMLDLGPICAIPFTIITIYIWKKMSKKYNLFQPKVIKEIKNKAIDYVIKIALVISVCSVWLVILLGPFLALFDSFIKFSDVMASSYNYLLNYLVFIPIYAILLTIISFYLWRVLYNRGLTYLVQKIKQNWLIILIIVVILVVLISSLFIWFRAEYRANLFWNDAEEGGLYILQLAIIRVRDTYDLAFKKIILLGGLLFTSAFLLIKIIPKKK